MVQTSGSFWQTKCTAVAGLSSTITLFIYSYLLIDNLLTRNRNKPNSSSMATEQLYINYSITILFSFHSGRSSIIGLWVLHEVKRKGFCRFSRDLCCYYLQIAKENFGNLRRTTFVLKNFHKRQRTYQYLVILRLPIARNHQNFANNANVVQCATTFSPVRMLYCYLDITYKTVPW